MVSTSSDLIDGVRRQDSLAWVRLVRIYSPLVYHWCRQKERLPPEDAADVLQDVFSAVAKGITGFQKNDNQGSFRGWLRRITTNKIHDFHRRNSQLAQATGGSDAVQQFNQVPDLFQTLPGEESLSSNDDICEESILINRILEGLRPQFKESSWKAFWQSELAGRPRPEIAEELGMSVDAVNMAVYRIRKRLREELEGFLE